MPSTSDLLARPARPQPSLADEFVSYRFQFTLSTGLMVVTTFAVACGVARPLEELVDFISWPSVLFMAVAAVVAQQGRKPDVAWSLLVIGWLIICIEILRCTWVCCHYTLNSCHGIRGEVGNEQIWQCYGNTLAIPLVMSCPVVFWACRATLGTPSRVRQNLIGIGLIAFINVTATSFFVGYLLEYVWGRR